MPTIETEVSVDFDLCDYEDEIMEEYCNDNCLKEQCSYLYSDLEDYLQDMYKNLYIYSENNRKIKTMEEIYDDLERILKEYK